MNCIQGEPVVREYRWQLRKGRLAIEVSRDDSMWCWLDSLRKRGVFKGGRIQCIGYTNEPPAECGRVFDRLNGTDYGTPLDLLLRHGCLTLHAGMFA